MHNQSFVYALSLFHFESFNDECRERSPGRKSVESGIKANAC